MVGGINKARDGYCDRCKKVTQHIKYYTGNKELFRTECLECGKVEYYV